MRGEDTMATESICPIGWRRLPLAEAGRWMSGGTPSTSNDDFWDGDIPWISAASLKKFHITDSDRRLTRLGAVSGSRLVQAGVPLFVVRGMSLKREFRIGVTGREVAFGQDCKALVPAEGIDPYFLAYAIRVRTSEILSMVEETSHGTGRLDTARLQKLQINVPPLDEQRKIVAAHVGFERRIGSIGDIIGKLARAEEALSDSVFAKRIMWPIKNLATVARVASGVTLGSEPVGEGSVELPYLRVANVLDGSIDTEDVKKVRILASQYEQFALRKGDLLLTEGGDLDKLGRGAVWDGRINPCLHQNHVFRVSCGPEILPDFLALYTSSPAGRGYFQKVGKQTTNLASINSTQVKAMPIPVPPLDNQERLLGPIHSVRARATSLRKQIVKLQVIQQGLAEDLVSGRVRL